MTRTTPNSQRYRFEDFTHEHYRDLLQLARSRYVFRLYDEFRRGEKFVLWRHDLDHSVADAVPLARLEAQTGVRATYFVHLYGDFYNPFARANLVHLEEIAGLGHAIGLHFDFTHHRIADEQSLCERLRIDAGRLEMETGLPVRAFSFHNPTQAALAFDADAYAGLVNTYARYFRQQVAYCSDSNGHWRHERLHDVLSRPADRPLQALTHPSWWTQEVMSPREKIERVLAQHRATVLGRYTGTVAAAGRQDIDW